MHPLLAALAKLARWIWSRAMPGALASNVTPFASRFADILRRHRAPTPGELLAELKNTAWTCASINSAVCANYPPHLYVATSTGQAQARCYRRPVRAAVERRLRSLPYIKAHTRGAERIEEVTDHPLLDLLAQVNPLHNSIDLWELTTLYQEVHGIAYWYVSRGPLGVPDQIWVLPTQNVTPKRHPDSGNIVDYYAYQSGARAQRFAPDEIIVFRYPDPNDPYLGGLSPLRACFESVALGSEYAAYKQAKFDHHAIPDAIVSPDRVIGEEERDRLNIQWDQRFRRGGAGRVVVAEGPLKVQLLNHSLGDVAALADLRASKEDIANAFHVPISFLTSQTNLANLQASNTQHMALAIGPRLTRRDEKLNEQLVPLFDPSGRLFLASEDPTPIDSDAAFAFQEMNLKYGVVTINEARSDLGLAPVPWGDEPWLNQHLRQPSPAEEQHQPSRDK